MLGRKVGMDDGSLLNVGLKLASFEGEELIEGPELGVRSPILELSPRSFEGEELTDGPEVGDDSPNREEGCALGLVEIDGAKLSCIVGLLEMLGPKDGWLEVVPSSLGSSSSQGPASPVTVIWIVAVSHKSRSSHAS